MVELTKENFEAEVLKAEGKVFVDFYSDGCVPCAALMPFVHQYAETYGDRMNGAQIDVLVKEDCTAESIEEMIKKHI